MIHLSERCGQGDSAQRNWRHRKMERGGVNEDLARTDVADRAPVVMRRRKVKGDARHCTDRAIASFSAAGSLWGIY